MGSIGAPLTKVPSVLISLLDGENGWLWVLRIYMGADDALCLGKLLSKCLVIGTTGHMLTLWRGPEFHISNSEVSISFLLCKCYRTLNIREPWHSDMDLSKGPRWILAKAVSVEQTVDGDEIGSPGFLLSPDWLRQLPFLLFCYLPCILFPAHLPHTGENCCPVKLSPHPPYGYISSEEGRRCPINTSSFHFPIHRGLLSLNSGQEKGLPPNPWEIWLGWKMWMLKLIRELKSQGNRSEWPESILRIRTRNTDVCTKSTEHRKQCFPRGAVSLVPDLLKKEGKESKEHIRIRRERTSGNMEHSGEW